MSDIIVRRNHGMTLKKARAAGEQIAADLAEEFDFTYERTGNTLNFKRMGVTGTIVVEKKSLEIQAKIGFCYAPSNRASNAKSIAFAMRNLVQPN